MTREGRLPTRTDPRGPGCGHPALPSEPVVYRHCARDTLSIRWGEPGAAAWLTGSEQEVYETLRDSRRREAWLFGRLLAKELVLTEALGPLAADTRAPTAIQIHSRDGLGRPTRPRILVDGRLQPWSLSIAHSDASILVALSATPGASVGVDLVPWAAFGGRALELWLTPWERRWLGGWGDAERSGWASALWAVKEAVYKAVGGGERFVPGRIEVRIGADAACRVHLDGAPVRGSCRVHIATVGGEVAAIVAMTDPAPRDAR